MSKCSLKVYWANAMFSDADRQYNAKNVGILRNHGCSVFLPQEHEINLKGGCTENFSDTVFRTDTKEVMVSDIIIACIDQETIDSGVAAEIGIAYSCGLPIIGLYTDLRQYRNKNNRMYKNPYIIGLINSNGCVVSSIDEILQILVKLSIVHKDPTIARGAVPTPDPEIYEEFVAQLEDSYTPAWSVPLVMDQMLKSTAPTDVLDFGCATGRLSSYFTKLNLNSRYTGFDISEKMIRKAKKQYSDEKVEFTSSWNEVIDKTGQKHFDFALIAFVLHDAADPDNIMRKVVDTVDGGGTILIIDLTTMDLPALTERIRSGAALPVASSDKRLDAELVVNLAEKHNCLIEGVKLHTPRVCFSTKAFLSNYIDYFGIKSGMDLPLGINKKLFNNGVVGKIIDELVEQGNFPFWDQRAFISCYLRKAP